MPAWAGDNSMHVLLMVCMNGLAIVEALWRHTGITGIIKHAI